MKRDEPNDMGDPSSQAPDAGEPKKNVVPRTPVNSPGASKIPCYPKRKSTPVPYLGRDKIGHYICAPSFSTRPVEEQRRISQLSEELRNDDRRPRLSIENICSSLDSSSSNSSTFVAQSSIDSSTIECTSFEESGRNSTETVIPERDLMDSAKEESISSVNQTEKRQFLGIPIPERDLMDSAKEESISSVNQTEIRQFRGIPIPERDLMNSAKEESISSVGQTEKRQFLGIPILGRGLMESAHDGPASAECETQVIHVETMAPILGSTRMETIIPGRILNERAESSISSTESGNERGGSSTGSSVQGFNLNDIPMYQQRTSSHSIVRERRIIRARRTPYTRSPAVAQFRDGFPPRGIPILGRKLSPIPQEAIDNQPPVRRQPTPNEPVEFEEGEISDSTEEEA